MGLDLTLIPIDHDSREYDTEPSTSWGFGHSLLQMDRDYELFKKFQRLESGDVPADFATFTSRDEACEEPHYGQTQETPYGKPLRCVLAGQLVSVKTEELSDRNTAVMAYLKALPVNTKVALYWS